MATVWKFAEYDLNTGALLHVAEFAWPGDAPETRGELTARVKANGNGIAFLAEDDALPDARTHRYDATSDAFVALPAAPQAEPVAAEEVVHG